MIPHKSKPFRAILKLSFALFYHSIFPPYPHPRRLAVVMRRRCNIKELSTFFVFFPRDIFRGVTNSPAGGEQSRVGAAGGETFEEKKMNPSFPGCYNATVLQPFSLL